MKFFRDGGGVGTYSARRRGELGAHWCLHAPVQLVARRSLGSWEEETIQSARNSYS